MIINCPCGKKKFQIDDSLIPDNGRLLQCGSCNQSWFFKPENSNENISIKSEAINKSIETKQDKYIKKKDYNKDSKKSNELTSNTKNYELTKYKKTSNFSLSKLLSLMIVLIISFVALIVFLDTFKTSLIDYVPNLEFLLYNLFETLKDIKLFIKDLT